MHCRCEELASKKAFSGLSRNYASLFFLRYSEPGGSSLTYIAFQPDCATVLLYNGLADCQSQPASFTVSRGSHSSTPVRIQPEDVVEIVRIDARAMINDSNFHSLK